MDTDSVYISVRGGSTDRPEVELRMGTPVEAFSVGSSASWKVNGSGIGSTHAYLFFDGRTLFVACAPGAIVKLQGAVVSTDWRPVTVPAEIELGGVVLGVASQRGGGAAASAGPSRGHAPLSQRGAARPSGGGRRPLPSASGAPAARQPAQHRPRMQEMPHGQGQSTAPQYARPPQAQAAQPGPRPHPSSPQHAPPQQAHAPPQQAHAPPQQAHAPQQSVPPWQQQARALPQPLPAAGRPAANEPEFEEDDMPTQFQAAPGFEAMEEDDPDSRTAVQDPGELLAAARRPEQSAKPERPKPPSIPPPASGGEATVVRPLEEYLAEAGGLPGAAEANRAAAPQPAAGAQGVYIQPPEPTMPPTGEAIWAARQAMAERGLEPPPGMPAGSPPEAWAQQQGMAPGMQDPNMPQGAWGQQQPGAYPQQPGAYPQQQPGAYPQQPGMAPAPGAKQSFLQKFRALPRSRKMVYAALPICMLAFLVIFEEDEPVQPAELAPSASAPSANASAPEPPASSAPAATQAPSPIPTPAPTGAGSGAPPPTETAAPEDPPPEKPKLAPGEVTKDRAAVDAVASGDFPKALKLYEELAKENPDNEAYRRAVEILKRRSKTP